MDGIRLHPDTPGTLGPFTPAGVDAWRADGELAGRRMRITIFAACGVTYGQTDWCWEVAVVEDGFWVLLATGAEASREAALGWVEEALWRLEGREKGRSWQEALSALRRRLPGGGFVLLVVFVMPAWA